MSKKYEIVNEVLNAVTHGIGCGLSIAGLVVLLVLNTGSKELLRIVAYTVFGSSLILLFLMSTLYHSLLFTKAKKVFRILDHSSIFILIAGTYTPFCMLAIGGKSGWILLGIIWAIAIAGVVYKAIWLEKTGKISTLIYLAMGWLIIFAMKPLYEGIGGRGILFLVLGGLSYTIGAFFYSKKEIKFIHVIWHLFVLLGAAMMYFAVLLYT